MAFKLEVLRGATSYDISNDNPFSLERADMLGGASVQNIEESGPYQDGATHLAERLEPRTITLSLFVKGDSAAALDGHRDTLMKIFKPVRGMPITLKVTRDDGSVRQIDTRRTGPLDIPLVPTNRPGNLHRAVVQLRAGDPAWYNPDEEEEVFILPQGDPWWTAGGSIPNENVLTHTRNPTQGQSWGGGGSIAAGSAWTIVFRSGQEPLPSGLVQKFAYYVPFIIVNFHANDSSYRAEAGGNRFVNSSGMMTSGTHTYYSIHQGGTLSVYRDTTLVGSDGTGDGTVEAINIAQGRWRGLPGLPDTYWGNTLSHAAVYNIALSGGQRSALHNTISGTATIDRSIDIAYDGDFDTYPVIVIRGPIVDPVIVNEATGDTLNFRGATLGSADVWTIDTRYGRKSVLTSGGSSALQYLLDDSDLATFRIVPDPIAAGGTNTISVGGDGVGTATSITLTYHNRYLSF